MTLASVLQLVLYGGVALLLLAALIGIASRAPRLFLGLSGSVYIAYYWRQAVTAAGALEFGIDFGPVYVSVLDVVFVAAACASVLFIIAHGRPGRSLADLPMVTLTLLAALGVVHWIAVGGLQSGVNAWRSVLYSLAFFWWARTVLGCDRRTASVFVALGALSSLVQAYGYLTGGFTWGGVVISGQYIDSRPLHAMAALFMVVGLSVLLYPSTEWSALRIVGAVLLGASAVISLHRSVWVSLLVLLAVWGLRSGAVTEFVRSRMSRLATAIVLLAGSILILDRSGVVSSAAEDNGTLLWREALWLERVQRDRSLGEWLLGGVAVPDEQRDLGSFSGTSHNMYIDVLEMFGLVGVLLLLSVIVILLRTQAAPPWLWASLMAVCAFGLFYPWPFWVWVLWGGVAVSGASWVNQAHSDVMHQSRGRNVRAEV